MLHRPLNFSEQTDRVAVKPSVNMMRRPPNSSSLALLLFAALFLSNRVGAVTPANPPIITSLSVVGTNLVFQATIPPSVNQAVLELRPTLTEPWQDMATLDVPVAGGAVEFIIPKPTWASAFFRLRTTNSTAAEAQVSTELQYVTLPSLAATGTDAVFHFKGVVDGSDRIVITHQGALWEHVNWDWPAGVVTINDAQWNPREKNYLTTTGAVAFLPETFSLATARLETIAGRDVVAMERTNGALIVYLNDTPSGAADYEFKIHFRLASETPATAANSPAATLKIAAAIDGSDVLKITPNEATWRHRAYSHPWDVSLNGIPWNVRQTDSLVNAGTNIFLPADVNLATARIIQRKGRDLATMWAEADALYIHFADNPNGADSYELEIAFGPPTRKPRE